MALTVGSLFSGIGGIDLGLERAGMVTRWFCEIDPHCRNVLARHWPGLPIYGDITAIDWSRVERVDVLAGGFPCQPVSSAGRQLAQADDRWLWPQFSRAIRALRPRYVLVENVRNLLSVADGSAFAEVLGDLATLGFDAEWDCIPASAIGAPHQRDRLWLVAYPARVQPGRTEQRPEWERVGTGGESLALAYAHRSADKAERGKCETPPGQGDLGRAKRSGRAGDAERQEPIRIAGQIARNVADTEGQPERAGLRPSQQAGIGRGRSGDGGGAVHVAHSASLGFTGPGEPLESLYPAPNPNRQAGESIDGRLAEQWVIEPAVGRVADGVPDRVERLRSLGNAVVPQIPELIGRWIVAFDEERVAA